MKREELANATEETIRASGAAGVGERLEVTVAMARDRHLGVGAEKYQISPDEQAFERSSIPVMLQGMREEIVDGINYVTMLRILNERQAEYDRALAETLGYAASWLVFIDAELQRDIARLGGDGMLDGEDYVDALNREVGTGWEAKRDV